MASGAIFNLNQACSVDLLWGKNVTKLRSVCFVEHLQLKQKQSWSSILKRLQFPASIFFLFYKPWNRTVSFMCCQIVQLIVLRFNRWNVLSTMITSVPPTYFLPHCSTLSMCLVFVDKARKSLEPGSIISRDSLSCKRWLCCCLFAR